ncbi:MAG: ABC transporter ATP-binding protein [Promethearchaeota archaeon]
MINLSMQSIGGPRFGTTLLESIAFPFILMVMANIINTLLKEEHQIKKSEKRSILFRAILPTFFITWPIRFVLDTLYTPSFDFSISELNIPAIFFAFTATVYFIFFTVFYKRTESETELENKLLQIKAFNKISRIFILILWIFGVGSIFLYLFQKMGIFSNTTVKILYLGFFWAPSTVIILSILVYFINQILPIENKRPNATKDRRATFFNVFIAFIGIIDIVSMISNFISLNFTYIWFLAIQILLSMLILYLQISKKNDNLSLISILVSIILNFVFSLYLLGIGDFLYNWWNGVRFIVLCMILIAHQISNRIPEKILKKTLIISMSFSVGFWIFQLAFFQFFWIVLRYFIDLPYFPQDLRLNIIITCVIFTVSFILTYKLKILPQAEKESQKNFLEALKKHETTKIDSEKINKKKILLDVKNLKTYFYTEEGIVRAVEGVSFKIFQGQVLGLVGETGCGKSVTALSIMQLIQEPGRIEGGQIFFLEEDLLQKSKTEILEYRGSKITMTFQDPLNSVNPVFKVGQQISEVFLLHKYDELLIEAAKTPGESIYGIARKWSIDLLKEVEIPDPESIFDRYPHELSGGMRQRILIAMGLACSPQLLIADEPTTALDVTIQNQILKLFKDLRKKYNTSMLFITHDLGIISKMCDVVAVMYSGFVVEYGDIKKLFITPYHPYTKGLISSIPTVGKKQKRLDVIQGMVPNLIYPPSGCRFHPRCDFCFEPCDKIVPELIEVEQDYYVACHLFDPKYSELSEKSIQKSKEVL